MLSQNPCAEVGSVDWLLLLVWAAGWPWNGTRASSELEFLLPIMVGLCRSIFWIFVKFDELYGIFDRIRFLVSPKRHRKWRDLDEYFSKTYTFFGRRHLWKKVTVCWNPKFGRFRVSTKFQSVAGFWLILLQNNVTEPILIFGRFMRIIHFRQHPNV